MKHDEQFWPAPDGARIYQQIWAPDGDARGVVCLAHGQGDHSGRYAHVAAALGEAGYATLACDHHGHGRSEGPRGHTPDYDALLGEVAQLLAEAERRFPGRPRFLYGHSMGGGLVLNYALRRRPAIAGVIATSPWLRLAFAPPVWKVTLGRLMDRLSPTFTQASGLDTKAISRDPQAVRAYEIDPLNHDKVSARQFASCYAAGLWALEHAGEFSLPLLLMHGDADRITSAAASREFAALVPGCTFKIWDGCYHEIHNEPEQQALFATITGWLHAHTS